jgi:hypothetical protein
MIAVFCKRSTAHLAAACMITLLVAPGPVGAQETRSVDVLGSITAEIGGDQLEWLTISGGLEGEDNASAVWSPYAPPDVLSHLSEEQRASMKKRMEMLGEMGASENPLAAMMGGGGTEGGDGSIKLRITGFDPEAERMLREGMLSIELSQFSIDDMDAALAMSHDADLSYFRNRGPDTGLYVSAHSVGTKAAVDLDRLEIGAEGHAEGRFTATLCPISTLMGGEPDPEVCVLISGEFSTELREETSSGDKP